MSQILITEQQLERLSRSVLREQSVVPRETFNDIQRDLNYLLSQKVETDPNILNKFSVVIEGSEDWRGGMTVTIGGAPITLKYDPPNAQRSSPEWGFWLTEPIYGQSIPTKGFISELIEKDSSYGDFFKNYPEVKDQIEMGTVKLEVTHDVMQNGALLIFSVASTKKPKNLKNLPSLGDEFKLGTFFNDNEATVRLSKTEYGTLHSTNLSYTLTSLVLKEPDWGGEEEEITPRVFSFAAGDMFNFNRATITQDAIDELNEQIINPIRSMAPEDRNAYIQKLNNTPITVTAYASRDNDPSESPYYTEETKTKLHQPCIGENTRGEYNQCLSNDRAQAVADYLNTTVRDIFGDVTFNSVGGGENCDSGNCWTKGKKNHKSSTTQSDRRFELTLPALVIK